MIKIAILACTILFAPHAAHADTTKPGWSGGRCYEYTPGGANVGELNPDECRKTNPSKPGWSGGRCFEYTPGGASVRELDAGECRKTNPSKPGWSGGRCFEYTPGGASVRELDLAECRKTNPSKPGWSGGRCFEYTPGGVSVRELDVAVCRKGTLGETLDPNGLLRSQAESGASVIEQSTVRSKVIPQSSTPEQAGSATTMDLQ